MMREGHIRNEQRATWYVLPHDRRVQFMKWELGRHCRQMPPLGGIRPSGC